MEITSAIFEKIQAIIKEYSIASVFIVTVSLIIFLLRKYHQKLVVYPQVGGRHNIENIVGYRHPREKGLKSEKIQIPNDMKKMLRGWYIKRRNAEKVILYFHQNAGNIGGRLDFVSYLLKYSKVNVLLVAYRGFSDSDGDQKPYQSEIMNDAAAILRKGIELSKRDRLPLFVFGASLGGAVAIHTLSRAEFKQSIKGLVLQNTFTRITDVVYNFLSPSLFFLNPLIWFITSGSYNSISKIEDIHVPILFIKGRRDTLVPTKLMDRLEQLFKKKNGQCYQLQVEKGTHNDTWIEAGQEYFNAINQFMNHCSKL